MGKVVPEVLSRNVGQCIQVALPCVEMRGIRRQAFHRDWLGFSVFQEGAQRPGPVVYHFEKSPCTNQGDLILWPVGRMARVPWCSDPQCAVCHCLFMLASPEHSFTKAKSQAQFSSLSLKQEEGGNWKEVGRHFFWVYRVPPFRNLSLRNPWPENPQH